MPFLLNNVFLKPANDVASLSVDRALLNSKPMLVNMPGKVLQTLLIYKTNLNINMHGYAKAGI